MFRQKRALAGALCFGPVEREGISGSLTYSTGALMAKVQVSLTNEATRVVSRAETTDGGLYKIPYLPACKYSVVMEIAGFTNPRVAEVPVLVGQIATIYATRKPGSRSEKGCGFSSGPRYTTC
jgi:hypothetical protein